MDNNQDKKPYKDELSEILGRKRNKKVRYESNFDDVKTYSPESKNTNNFAKQSTDRGSGESKENFRQQDNEQRNSDENLYSETYSEEPQIDAEELHDVDFDEIDGGEEEPVKKSRRVIEAEKKLRKHRQARNTVLRVIMGIIVSGFVLFFGVKLGSGIYSALTDYAGIGNNEFQVQIELPNNPTVDQVAEVLSENGIITTPDFFKKYVELKQEKKEVTDFVGGQFTLSSTMNYGTIVSTLLASKNQIITVEITIVEGMTAYDIGKLLEDNFVCKAEDFQKFYKDKMDVYDFEKRILVNSHKFNQMEGYLFPDKYEFYVCNELKDDPKAEIDTTKEAEVAAKKIYSNFNSKISKSMYKKMHEMGLTLDEFVALASMVQAEVNNVDDMKLVASVFLNRLNSNGENPKLQSDPTVFYVQDYIEPFYKDYGLTTSLAVISNSYDTYECDGVPAGAICNPGIDAMNSVLDAAQTDYFYFCANTETGETFYARTLEEHQQNLVLAGLA